MATSDLEGLDPTGARTPEDFMHLLRAARDASGLSIAEIAETARRHGYDLEPAGLARALEDPALPSWQTVTGVLVACGLGGMQIDRWMRVYHDLAAPAQPAAPAAPASPLDDLLEAAPVSVPPLVLSTAPARPTRLGPRNLAIAGVVLAALIAVPLVFFALSDSGPEGLAAAPTGTPPRTVAAPPAPSPTDALALLPSPTDAVPPSSPAPVTSRPPARTTAPPPPPPPPPLPQSPPPSPVDPAVFRSGVAALTGDGEFDLDGGGSDISRWDGDTLVRMNGAWLEPTSSNPSKLSCQAEQGWENRVGHLQAGQWLCVRTSENRYGRLNITATGETLKLVYTVWN